MAGMADALRAEMQRHEMQGRPEEVERCKKQLAALEDAPQTADDAAPREHATKPRAKRK